VRKLALLLACLPGVAEAAAYQGQTLEQALEQLRERGIAIFYSSDLVKPWMRVEREPTANEPRALLTEILAPHGITVADGPDGALVLVREIQRAPRRAAPGAAHSPAPTPLDAVVVSASTYLFGGDTPLSSAVFSADQLETLPEIGEDPLRAVSRLPGVARQDFSSRVHLRGGTDEETLVRFDDLRLYDPFHFKDFYGIFSAIDPDIVSDIRVYTGGFPVTFGDRSSGVVEVAPRLPERQFHGQAVFSLFTAGASADGSWNDGAGDWAVAARRSNMSLFFNLANQSIGEPDYHDLYAHVGIVSMTSSQYPPTLFHSWIRSSLPTLTRRKMPGPSTVTITTGCAWTSAPPTGSAGACSSRARNWAVIGPVRPSFPASRPAR